MLAVLTCQAPASTLPAALAQTPSAAAAEAPGAIPALLAPATAPALGPGPAALASGPPSMAQAAAAAAQATAGGGAPAHVPAVVIAAPVAGGVVLGLLLAGVAMARAGLTRKARQTALETLQGSCTHRPPGMRQPLGHSSTPALFSDYSMALPKIPIRQARLTHCKWGESAALGATHPMVCSADPYS